MSIRTGKRALIIFWFEAFLVFITFMVQVTSSHYNRDTDVIQRAPLWSWHTYLIVHVIAFAALLLALAALLTIKYVHDAERRELEEKHQTKLK